MKFISVPFSITFNPIFGLLVSHFLYCCNLLDRSYSAHGTYVLFYRYDFKPASAIAAAEAGAQSSLTIDARSTLPHATLTTPGATLEAPSSTFEGNALPPKAGVCDCLLVFDRDTRQFRLELVRHTFKLKYRRGAAPPNANAAGATAMATNSHSGSRLRSPAKHRSPAKPKPKSPGPKRSRILQQSASGSSSCTLLSAPTPSASSSTSAASAHSNENPTPTESAHGLALPSSSSLPGAKHSHLSESTDDDDEEEEPPLVVAPLPFSALLATVAQELQHLSGAPDRPATPEISPTRSCTSKPSDDGSHAEAVLLTPDSRDVNVDQVAHDLELSPTGSPRTLLDQVVSFTVFA